jgi:hypothetical protein
MTVSAYASLANLKSAAATDRGYIFAPPTGIEGSTAAGTFFYQAGDFTGADDDVNIIAFNSTSVTTGALVRQSSAGITVQQSALGARILDNQSKVALGISVYDFIPSALWADTRAATTSASFDSTPYIQDAINAAAARGASCVDFHGARLRVNVGNIQWPVEKVTLVGSGAILDCRGMLSGALLLAQPSSSDRNLRPGYAATTRLSGFTFWGPSGDAADCIVFDDSAAGVKNISGVGVEHCFFHDWHADIRLQNGAFGITFFGCTFTALTAPASSGYSIEIEEADNGGEAIKFISCWWYNRTRLIRQANGNASTFLTACQLDYCNGNFVNLSGGTMTLTACHIEGDSDADDWFSVTATDALLRVVDSVLAMPAERNDTSPFYSAQDVAMGGVEIDGLHVISGPNLISTPLVRGTGRVLASRVVSLQNGNRLVIGAGANLLAYGGFESANWSGEWTVTDPMHVKLGTPARTGAHSLEIEGVIAVTQQATFTAPAQSGQFLTGELYYQTLGLTGSNGTFFVGAQFLDAGGQPLVAQNQLVQTTMISSWTRAALSLPFSAPPGTRQVKVFVSMFGVSSGTPKGLIDDVVLNLS